MTTLQVVILGAGVAGLRIAKKLKRELRLGEAKMLLVDQNDYHQLLYRLHKTCNYEYNEKDIIVPLKPLINDTAFKKATVETINIEKNTVKTNEGDIPYDILVVAMGSHPAYFNIEGIREHSLTLSNYEKAKQIRQQVFESFEKAAKTKEPPKIVVGGAGFTGIELAGELCDCLPRLYRDHEIPEPKKILSIVEALPTILPGWDEGLVKEGTKFLESKKVDLYLNNPVVKVGDEELLLKDGTALTPDIFVWTGGVEMDPACGPGFEVRSRRIAVNEYLQPEGMENIFVAGDQACAVNNENRSMPPNAHIAMMQADVVVSNIISKLRDRPMKKYQFGHAGEVVTFGHSYAVGEVFGINLKGLPAKIMKQFIHLWYLHSIGGFKLLFEYW